MAKGQDKLGRLATLAAGLAALGLLLRSAGSLLHLLTAGLLRLRQGRDPEQEKRSGRQRLEKEP